MMEILSAKVFNVLIVVLVASTSLTMGAICQSSICEYHFSIRKSRTMIYETATDAFNVALNQRNLQIVENAYHRASDFPSYIGKTVDAANVITGDGFPRNLFLINDQFPGPTIEVRKGAQIVVHVTNNLNTEGLTVHWHGMEMNRTPWMDGTAYVTQCPVLPHQKFTYRFVAGTEGTHWYHAHSSNMRLDAFLGFLIVHKSLPTIPYFTMSVMEWLHVDYDTMAITNPSAGLKPGNGDVYLQESDSDFSVDGSEISSLKFYSALINGRGRYNNKPFPLHTYKVNPMKRYRFRMAHTGIESPFEISIDQHKIYVLAQDGHPIKPIGVDSVLVFPGETLDFEIRTNQLASKYWIRATMFREGRGPNVIRDGVLKEGKAILAYANAYDYGTVGSDPRSRARICTKTKPCRMYNCPFKGFPTAWNKLCVNIDSATYGGSLDYIQKKYGLSPSEKVIEYFFNFGFQQGASINGRSFVQPRRPPILGNFANYIKSCDDATCDSAGCKCTHIKSLPFNKTVQLVLTNYDPARTALAHHPIHTHGHNFAVVKVGYPDYNPVTGRWAAANPDITCNDALCAKPRWTTSSPPLNLNNPSIKDTIAVPARGYVVIRFRTEMEGYWFMHCHQEEHFLRGMVMLFEEGPQHIKLPVNFPHCGDYP